MSLNRVRFFSILGILGLSLEAEIITKDSNPSLVLFLGVLKIDRVLASFLYSIVQGPASIADA